MIDWMKNDPPVPASAKAKNEVHLLYVDPWLKVCGDLATACKHFCSLGACPSRGRPTRGRVRDAAVLEKALTARAN